MKASLTLKYDPIKGTYSEVKPPKPFLKHISNPRIREVLIREGAQVVEVANSVGWLILNKKQKELARDLMKGKRWSTYTKTTTLQTDFFGEIHIEYTFHPLAGCCDGEILLSVKDKEGSLPIPEEAYRGPEEAYRGGKGWARFVSVIKDCYGGAALWDVIHDRPTREPHLRNHLCFKVKGEEGDQLVLLNSAAKEPQFLKIKGNSYW
tara:strand:- start:381 stop:1001 length:621 start_codon:yes stop_codon:yes gene_type:complete